MRSTVLLLMLLATVYSATFTVKVQTPLSHEFMPNELYIESGDTVQWTGLAKHHNLLEVSSATDIKPLKNGLYSGPVVNAQTWSNTFQVNNKTFYFVCEPYVECCNMRMTVYVRPKGSLVIRNAASTTTISLLSAILLLLL
jgi:plastocyanin